MAEGLIASDLTVAVGFGAAYAVLVAFTTFVVGVVIGVIGDGDAVGDVERFLELSTASRYSRLPRGPLLSDANGDVSEAIGELLARKEEARQALWSSHAVRAPR